MFMFQIVHLKWMRQPFWPVVYFDCAFAVGLATTYGLPELYPRSPYLRNGSKWTYIHFWIPSMGQISEYFDITGGFSEEYMLLWIPSMGQISEYFDITGGFSEEYMLLWYISGHAKGFFCSIAFLSVYYTKFDTRQLSKSGNHSSNLSI